MVKPSSLVAQAYVGGWPASTGVVHSSGKRLGRQHNPHGARTRLNHADGNHPCIRTRHRPAYSIPKTRLVEVVVPVGHHVVFVVAVSHKFVVLCGCLRGCGSLARLVRSSTATHELGKLLA